MVKKTWCLLLIIIFSEFIYLKTLLIGPGFHDLGELQTASCTLGIAHPPGYPTYVILGKLFTLLPVGNIAWRVNFMSAFFSIMSLALFFLICDKIFKSKLASLLTTFILMFSKNFWEFSLIAEMYSLNVFFILTTIYFLTNIFNSQKQAHLLQYSFFFFIIGLGQGNHRGLTIITPLIVLALLIIKPAFFLRIKNLVKISIAFFLGLSIYLFLPLRSLQNPYLNYAHPANWKNFKYLVSAEQFRYLMFNVPLTQLINAKIPWFINFLFDQFYKFGIILAVLGFFYMLLKKQFAFLLLILTIFLITAYVWLSYNTNDIYRYLTPTLVMTAFFITAGISAILSLINLVKNSFLRICSVMVLSLPFLLFIFILLKINYPKVDRSKDLSAYNWGTAVLRRLKPQAVFISHWGYSPSLWYLQGCEKIRPDILIADDRVMDDEGWENPINTIKHFINSRPVYTLPFSNYANDIKRAGFNYQDEYWFYEVIK